MNAIHMYMICQCFLHECHILRGAVSENCHEMAIFSFSFFFLFRGDIFSHILAIINRRVWIGSLADPQAEDPSLKLAGLPLYSIASEWIYSTRQAILVGQPSCYDSSQTAWHAGQRDAFTPAAGQLDSIKKTADWINDSWADLVVDNRSRMA